MRDGKEPTSGKAKNNKRKIRGTDLHFIKVRSIFSICKYRKKEIR